MLPLEYLELPFTWLIAPRQLNLNTAYLLALIAAAGLVLSILLLWIAKTFTKIVSLVSYHSFYFAKGTILTMHCYKQILEICLLLSVAFSIGYAIYLWIEKYWSGAIIFTVFAIIAVICYFPMRRRIPLSKLLLQFVFKIASESHLTTLSASGKQGRCNGYLNS